MSIVEIKVPDIGGHENVDIIAVEVKAGARCRPCRFGRSGNRRRSRHRRS